MGGFLWRSKSNVSNSDPRLDEQNEKIKKLEEQNIRIAEESKRREDELKAEKLRIELEREKSKKEFEEILSLKMKAIEDNQRREYEKKLSLEKIEYERKMMKEKEDQIKKHEFERKELEKKRKKEQEQYEQDKQRLLKEKEEEKKNIEKHGWDCKEYPRKPWQNKSIFNVAVSGKSGTGKSTLVNSILGIKKAKVGITETTDVLDRETFEPPRYSYSTENGVFSNLKVLDVFDLPGCGTEKFPISSYIKNFGLRYFDMVIIVVAERIYQADTMLKKELDKFNIPCIVVRNKVDLAVESNLYDNDIPEEETLNEIRKDFYGKGITNPLLLSARKKSYDWDKLKYEFIRSFKRMNGNAEFVEKDLDNTCDKCYNAWIDTQFQDCGHRLFCSKCVQKEEIRNCQKCGKSNQKINFDD